jgi:trans-2,3-dihydro-3-hydroxyanthranilate isomerase
VPVRYLHYDVFTREPLTGNQLAVFLEGRAFAPEEMQAVAREMKFSESTFILPAERFDTDVRMRIFTPAVELPIAGHPTIGSAFALAEAGVIAPATARFVFGLGVGPVPVTLEWDDGRLRFAWMTQPDPTFGTVVTDVQHVAAALGVPRSDLATDMPIQEVSCGVPFLLVPLATRAAVDRAVSDAAALRALHAQTGLDLGVYLFTLDPGELAATVYSRMFAPQFGIAEDPATGSACGPLGAYLVQHGFVRGDAAERIVNIQGVSMGRPSRIAIAIGGTPERITDVRVGGEAVLVARGELVI